MRLVKGADLIGTFQILATAYRGDRVFNLIVGGMFLFGTISAVLGAILLVRFLRYRIFPTVPGKLDFAEVTPLMTDGKPTFLPNVRYEYEVSGSRFSSTRIFSLTPLSASKKWADKFVAALEQAPKLKVYYDPAKPDFSFLRNGPRMAIALWLITGILFLSISLYLGLPALRYFMTH